MATPGSELARLHTIVGDVDEVARVLRTAQHRGTLVTLSAPVPLPDGRIKVNAWIVNRPNPSPVRRPAWRVNPWVVTGVAGILALIVVAVMLIVHLVSVTVSWTTDHGKQIGIVLLILAILAAMRGRGGGGGTFSGTFKGTFR